MQFTKNSLVLSPPNFISLKLTDSTNNYAKSLITSRNTNSRPIPDGAVIMAEQQTAGRGQQGNSWHSTAGKNILCSIIHSAAFLEPSAQFLISITASLAVRDLLVAKGISDIAIKWPNDVYSGCRKIAGLLIENLIQGNSLFYTIVGIGINVNEEAFPEALSRAISMKMRCQTYFDVKEVMEELLFCFDLRWQQLKNSQHTLLLKTYTDFLMGFEVKCKFASSNRSFEGVIRGISGSGELLIEENNRITAYRNKEIEFVFAA